MYRGIKDLHGNDIAAIDGNIGEVHTFYFEDDTWAIRYLVADTGKWLPGRRVLLSTAALEKPKWETEEFPVDLTKKQIENSPDISNERPVSRQKEIEVINYYKWPVYWTADRPRDYGHPNSPAKPSSEGVKRESMREKDTTSGDPHLRDSREVLGYGIHASDGEIGRVEDFIIDDENWEIYRLVIDTSSFILAGKKVIISPDHVKSVDWTNSKVHVDLSTEDIKNTPEFDYSKLEIANEKTENI